MNAITVESVEKDRISEPVAYLQQEMDSERDAREMLQRVWMLEGPSVIDLPVDVFKISRRLGVEVFTDDELPPEVSGVLRKPAGFRDPEIFLNPMDAHNRRRFTCAHALGHYSRNSELGRSEVWEFVEGRDFLSAEIGDAEEVYATRFAAELLMPRTVLSELTDVSSVAALAGMFGVTGDVMRFRLDQIGWK